MDFYCLGGNTWLICGPKEAQTIQYTLLGAAKRPPKGYIAKFGFLWAANQPGFSPQAVNIHHPTELSRSELERIFLVGVTPPVVMLSFFCAASLAVRMMQQCKFSVGGLDLICRGVGIHFQHCVERPGLECNFHGSGQKGDRQIYQKVSRCEIQDTARPS